MASAIRRTFTALSSSSCKFSARMLLGNGSKHRLHPMTLKRTLSCLSSFDKHSSKTRLSTAYSLCRRCQMHTEVDQELVKHLEEEISNEKKAEQKKVAGIEGWDVKANDSEVILQKKHGDEILEVKLNVNNSVRADDQGQAGMENEQPPVMVSKPMFEVSIKKASGKVLSFECDFFVDQEFQDESLQQEQDVGDLFNISEVTLHDGKVQEQDYLLSADVMDATMYDLLMDMLDERGISNDFVVKLVDFCTSYEHDQYVSFLEKFKAVLKE